MAHAVHRETIGISSTLIRRLGIPKIVLHYSGLQHHQAPQAQPIKLPWDNHHKMQYTRFLGISAALIPAAILFSGCTSSGTYVSDWGEITLAPGDTGTCSSNPCRVFFEMPPGTGTYTVTGTGFTIGGDTRQDKPSVSAAFSRAARSRWRVLRCQRPTSTYRGQLPPAARPSVGCAGFRRLTSR